jgi:5,10-methylenetetrahydromethanopterin reductase
VTRFGVTLQGVDEPKEFVRLVRRIEELGFDDLWLTDSSLHAGDCYVYATLALDASSRLRVGTAVTNPLTRHPGITANAFRTLDLVGSQRVVCGIGVGDRPLGELGLPMAKLQTLRETVETLRRLWNGETIDGNAGRWTFDGGRLLSAVEPAPPVHISASGPKALELTGEIADGVILLTGLFPEGLAFAREQLARGRERSALAFEETVFLYGAINDDEERALGAARSIAAWFPKTAPDYARLAGMSEELITAVNAAYAGGEFQHAQDAAKLISDDLVRKIAFCGSPSQAAKKLEWLRDEQVQSMSIFPLGPDRLETIRHFAEIAIKRT